VEPRIEFVNHASVVVDDGQGTRLLTDPWLDGHVFNNGWALLSRSAFGPADFESITHIWISHEHPDHFHPTTLKRIPEARRAQIVLLYQHAPDLAAAHEIKAFCAKLGFREFVELPARQHVSVGANLQILCRRHMWGDSWCHLRLPRGPGGRPWAIFNANDCEWETPAAGAHVFAELGPVDVLLMQFSYACWYPDRTARRREADRLIERLIMMTEASGARFVIPFASFVRFCHEDNGHMNDEMNKVHRAAEAIESRTPARAVALYPGDVWTLGHDPAGAEALRRYGEDYALAAGASLMRDNAGVPLDELERKLSAFWARHRTPDAAGSGPDLRLFLWDLQIAVEWCGTRLAVVAAPEADCDIALASSSLAFLFDARWGIATLGVNARYRLPARSRLPSLSAIELAVVRALGRRDWLVAGSVSTAAYGSVPEL
jgi:UDP-MurNAc hydroxylase